MQHSVNWMVKIVRLRHRRTEPYKCHVKSWMLDNVPRKKKKFDSHSNFNLENWDNDVSKIPGNLISINLDLTYEILI